MRHFVKIKKTNFQSNAAFIKHLPEPNWVQVNEKAVSVLIVLLCTSWIRVFNSCLEIWFGQVDLLSRPVDIASGLFDILHGLKVLNIVLWGVAWCIMTFFSFPFFSTCHEALRTTWLKALVRAWVIQEKKTFKQRLAFTSAMWTK